MATTKNYDLCKNCYHKSTMKGINGNDIDFDKNGNPIREGRKIKVGKKYVCCNFLFNTGKSRIKIEEEAGTRGLPHKCACFKKM